LFFNREAAALVRGVPDNENAHNQSSQLTFRAVEQLAKILHPELRAILQQGTSE